MRKAYAAGGLSEFLPVTLTRAFYYHLPLTSDKIIALIAIRIVNIQRAYCGSWQTEEDV